MLRRLVELRHRASFSFQARQEIPLMLNSLVLHDPHFVAIRIWLNFIGVIQDESVHPGYEFGTNVIDEVAGRKSITIGCALHSVTSNTAAVTITRPDESRGLAGAVKLKHRTLKTFGL